MKQNLLKSFKILSTALLFFATPAQAEPTNLTTFLKEISLYFDHYYEDIQQGKKIPQTLVLEKIYNLFYPLEIITASSSCPSTTRLGQLNCQINAQLNPFGKGINLFFIDDSPIIQCWLGDLVNNTNDERLIWEQSIHYSIIILQNLIVPDYTHWQSNGQQSLEVGTQDGIIYINRDAYLNNAQETWTFLNKAYKGKLKNRYDVSQANKIRKQLIINAWGDLFQQAQHQYTEEARIKEYFLEQYQQQKMQNSLVHELGHIYVRTHHGTIDNTADEMMAMLTELHYAPVSQDALDFLVTAAWAQSTNYYNQAGRLILRHMVTLLQQQQPFEKSIRVVIRGKNLAEQSHFLTKLTTDNIRTLSQHLMSQLFFAKTPL